MFAKGQKKKKVRNKQNSNKRTMSQQMSPSVSTMSLRFL